VIEMDKTIYEFLHATMDNMFVLSSVAVWRIQHTENTYLMRTIEQEDREYIIQGDGLVARVIDIKNRTFVIFRILRLTHFHEIWHSSATSTPSLGRLLRGLRRLW